MGHEPLAAVRQQDVEPLLVKACDLNGDTAANLRHKIGRRGRLCAHVHELDRVHCSGLRRRVLTGIFAAGSQTFKRNLQKSQEVFDNKPSFTFQGFDLKPVESPYGVRPEQQRKILRFAKSSCFDWLAGR